LRGYIGSDLPKHNPNIKTIECPFTGERLAAVPALRPDVTVVHAQQANRAGDVLIHGIVGIQKEAILAAKRAIVTVEEIVDDFAHPPHSVVVPNWVISAVCEVPGGAKPSYAHGYYHRDNAFYIEWDEIARDRDRFVAWIDQNVKKVPANA
jgi:glutaconate CoA-transferase, subunit A